MEILPLLPLLLLLLLSASVAVWFEVVVDV